MELDLGRTEGRALNLRSAGLTLRIYPSPSGAAFTPDLILIITRRTRIFCVARDKI